MRTVAIYSWVLCVILVASLVVGQENRLRTIETKVTTLEKEVDETKTGMNIMATVVGLLVPPKDDK